MAHPKREARAIALAEQLGAGIVWDRGQGLWDTARRSWLEQDGEWHTVIQDDALPVKGFRDNLERILEHAYPYPVSWYFGTGRPKPEVTRLLATQADTEQASWIAAPGPWWAVAVSVHSSHIEAMIDSCDRTRLKADDARYTVYFRKLQIPCLYTWPSLIDHDDLPSIAGPGQRGTRKAYKTGDAGKFNPEGPRLVASPQRRPR